MKAKLNSRYIRFMLFYLTLISMVMMSVVYSRYQTGNEESHEGRVTEFRTDFVIYKGYRSDQPELFRNDVDIHILATSKLSEPATMINGETCELTRVRFINESETSVMFKSFTLDGSIENGTSAAANAYTKLIVDADEAYLSEHDDSLSKAAKAYLKTRLDEFNTNPATISDSHQRQRLSALRSYFSSDPDFQWNGSAITYDESRLSDVAYLNRIVLVSNKITKYLFDTEDTSGTLLVSPRSARTIMIISWVEHDNIYKADADANAATDRISHRKPSLILLTDGHEDESLKETLVISTVAEQYD